MDVERLGCLPSEQRKKQQGLNELMEEVYKIGQKGALFR
jgi:hypothetical protein